MSKTLEKGFAEVRDFHAVLGRLLWTMCVLLRHPSSLGQQQWVPGVQRGCPGQFRCGEAARSIPGTCFYGGRKGRMYVLEAGNVWWDAPQGKHGGSR